MAHATSRVLRFLVLGLLLLAGCAVPAPSAVPTAAPAQTAAATPAATPAPTATPAPPPATTRPTQVAHTATPRPTATPRCPTATPPPTATAPLQPVAFELLGQAGGASRAVAVQGELAYLGVGPRLVVVDVADAAAPRLLAQSEVLPGVVEAVVLQGPRAYVAAGPTLVAFDLADPRSPRRLGEHRLPQPALSLAVRGSVAYVATGACGGETCDGSLCTVDIGDPTQMRTLGHLELPDYPKRLAIAGDYVYLACSRSGLRVIDVHDPANPQHAGALPLPGGNTVAVVGRYAYLVASWDLHVVDVSDPANPRQVGTSSASTFSDIAVVEGYAYLTGRYCDVGVCFDIISVIDVRDAAAPKRLAERSALDPGAGSAGSGGLAVAAGRAYRACDDGLEIRAATDSTLPVLGKLDTAGWVEHLALWAGHAVTVDSARTLHTIDVRDPAQAAEVARLRASSIQPQARLVLSDVAVAGGVAYVLAWDDGLWGVDVRDPAHPREILRMPLGRDLLSVAAAGEYVYTGGMHALDMHDPTAPQELAAPTLPGRSYSLALAGGYAYVADETQGIWIVDLRDPAQARKVGLAAPLPGTTGVAAGDGTVYAAIRSCYAYDCCGGLAAVDVRDPAAPRQVSYLPLEGGSLSVAVAGRTAYVDSNGTLLAIDVADPAHPRLAGSYPLPSTRVSLVVDGDRVYVANWDAGLLILRASSGT